mgnify:CR=1 FL=1
MYEEALVNSGVGVALNVILAYGMAHFASADQIKPPSGAAGLKFPSQVMHMLVHHKQVIFTSSLIVFVLVFLSTVIGKYAITLI